MNVEDKEIHELFLSVMESATDNTAAVREVFSVLVRSTLRYRDRLLASEGITVTVEDVRTALDWLVPALTAGQMPATDNKIRLGLLKIWLDELRRLERPGAYMT